MKFLINGQSIERVEHSMFVEGSKNIYEVEFEFSEDWNGFTKIAVFKRIGDNTYPDGYPVLVADGIAKVPVGILQYDGAIKIGVWGSNDGKVKPTTWADSVKVMDGVAIGDIPDPDPTIFEQFLAYIEEVNRKLAEIQADITLIIEAKAEVLANKEVVEQDKAIVEQTKAEFVETVSDALEAVNTAKTNAVSEINSTKQGAVDNISEAERAALGSITTSKNDAISGVNAVKDTSVNAVNSAKETGVSAVNSAKTSGVSAVNTAKETAIADIGTTKADGVGAVINSKDDALGKINTAKEISVSAVDSARNNALTTIQEQEAASKQAITEKADEQVARIPDYEQELTQLSQDKANQTDFEVLQNLVGEEPASENAGLQLLKMLKEHANKLGGLVDIIAELPSDEAGAEILANLKKQTRLLIEIANNLEV